MGQAFLGLCVRWEEELLDPYSLPYQARSVCHSLLLDSSHSKLTRLGQVHSFITALAADNVARRNKDESSSDDESRRFKVEIKHVAVIDLEKVMDFCNPHKRSPSGEEECLTGELNSCRGGPGPELTVQVSWLPMSSCAMLLPRSIRK